MSRDSYYHGKHFLLLKTKDEYLSRSTTKLTQWHVHPVKTQISLDIRPVWSKSSLCALWVAKDPKILHVDSKDSDQTGCTGHFFGLSCCGSFVQYEWYSIITFFRWKTASLSWYGLSDIFSTNSRGILFFKDIVLWSITNMAWLVITTNCWTSCKQYTVQFLNSHTPEKLL